MFRLPPRPRRPPNMRVPLWTKEEADAGQPASATSLAGYPRWHLRMVSREALIASWRWKPKYPSAMCVAQLLGYNPNVYAMLKMHRLTPKQERDVETRARAIRIARYRGIPHKDIVPGDVV